MHLTCLRGAAVAACAFGLLLAAPAHAQVRIVALGGSSTAGQGVSSSEAYPAKLQAALRARGIQASVTNAGISGDSSRGGLSRVDSVAPAGTKVAIVELGVNDRFQGIDAATTKANINQIVAKLRARGTQVLLFGYRDGGQQLASVASAHGASFMMFGAFPNNGDPKYRVANDPQATTRGYGHFNGAGYDQVVAMMMPQISALIAKAK